MSNELLCIGTFSKEINDYLEFKGTIWSPTTLMTRKNILRNFCRYIDSFSVDKEKVTKEIILGWCKKSDNEKVSNQITRIFALRSFLEYLSSIGFNIWIPPKYVTKSAPRYVLAPKANAKCYHILEL